MSSSNVTIIFPYPNVKPLAIPDSYTTRIFTLPEMPYEQTGLDAVRTALENPVQSARLRDIARGNKRVLIVSDDNTRPTPVRDFVILILQELGEAGIKPANIEFIMSLGTHRPMTEVEMNDKLGSDIVRHYRIHNHHWKDVGCIEYLGETAQGVSIRVNKILCQFDVVVGLGSIMPIDVCGFTGGGKILVPGLAGEETVDQMHRVRVNVASEEVLGKEDNPIRESIDA